MILRVVLIWFVLLTFAILNGGFRHLFAGRIWVLVLIVTLMTPIVAFTRRGM